MRLFRQLPVVLLLLVALGAQAQQPEFPALSGRVVDQAEMLDAADEARLTKMLAAHEQASSEQVVVVTLPNLQGETIEQYGYQLGRHWGIGQKGEDNGALLIVARDERKVRIEVGYGLEGRLTDAQSAVIINQVITPALRQGDFPRGILEGTQAMIQVLGGDPLATTSGQPAAEKQGPDGPKSILFFLLLLAVTGFLGGGRGGRGRRGILGGLLLGAALGGRGGNGGGGGLGGGGGFSGGGGGFGGGGASGGW